jgi:hypothetical protein
LTLLHFFSRALIESEEAEALEKLKGASSAMTSTVKLTYFNLRGLAENTRIMLAIAKVDED